MDWLTFISHIVSFLIWPLVGLIIYFNARDPILKLIGRIETLKYGKFEINVRADIQKVEDLIRTPQAVKQLDLTEASAQNSPYDTIISRSPKEAMLKAWQDVEKAALIEFKRHAVRADDSKPLAPILLAGALRSQEHINEHYYQVFLQLAHIRNRVVHEPDIIFEAADASSYCSLALEFIAYLESKRTIY